MIETRRADGARVVTVTHGRGYLERPLARRPGFVARTYVVGGRSYVRVYHAHIYHGIEFHRYVPVIRFHPEFYAWAYRPWRHAIVFDWGWYGTPWLGYYGAYFVPAPAYATPALWLTDFLLAENLKLAYESRQGALEATPAGDTAALSPEIKQLIAQEVRQEIEAARTAAPEQDASPEVSEAAPAALDPSQRVFVVSMNLDVPVAGGACSLTPGDILLRSTDGVRDDGSVGVTVLSSKPGDCAVNSSAAIDLPTLEEMHNDFRQQIDSGLAVLASNQGKHNLPKGPAAKPQLVSQGHAEADLDASAALLEQEREAELSQN